MIKCFKVFFIILVTIICTFLINNFFQKKKENFSPIFYQTHTNQSNLIEVNDLKIVLKGFYDTKISKEQISSLSLDEGTVNNILNFSKDYNLLIDLSNIDGKLISEPIFDYFIYDNSGNVIFTSMIYKKNAKETNNFLKYFMKNKHNSNDITNLSNYIVSSGTSIHIVDDSNNSNLILISSSINDDIPKELDLSKLHILILNPSYKISGNNNRIFQENTVYEFILEN